MDIYEKLNDRYAELASAGYNLDDAIRNDIVAEYQNRWDSGERFADLSAVDMFLGAKREADTEKEISACVDELASRIKSALVEQWASRYDRAQMVGVLNAITDLDVCASVNMYGVGVAPHEIVRAWNKKHSDAEPICKTSRID